MKLTVATQTDAENRLSDLEFVIREKTRRINRLALEIEALHDFSTGLQLEKDLAKKKMALYKKAFMEIKETLTSLNVISDNE